MQSIQQLGRLAATAALGILTCAVASGCGKKDQARTNAAQNTAAANDTTLSTTQGGNIASNDTSYAARSATPPTGGDSAGLQSSAGRPTTTTSQGGTVPARTTRRTSTRRSTSTATEVGAATGVAATPRSNREPDVSGRSAEVSTDTSAEGSRLTTTADPTFLAEPQIYTIVFLANMGDSSVSARAICRNPTVTGSAPTALDEQVRTFAQRMVNDHGQLNRRVAEMQRTKNIIPTRSDVSDQVFSANSDAMGTNENSRDYIAREVRAHQATLNTLDTRLIPNARDSSLRVLLVEARALVQNHLNEAQRISSGTTAANTSTSAQPMNMSMSASRDSLSASARVTSPARPDTIRANSNATMYQSPTTNATASAAITTTAPSTTAPSDATKPATSSALNPASPTPVAQQYATAPTSAPAAQPCDTNARPAASTTPSVSPSNVAPVRADTARGYDSRVRSDTAAIRQPAPAPAKP